MSSKFIVSNRVHDPPRDFTSVPACTYIDSSGQEFIDMETHQMDIDARDAAYRQEVHNRLVRQQSDPAQKAELKALLTVELLPGCTDIRIDGGRGVGRVTKPGLDNDLKI